MIRVPVDATWVRRMAALADGPWTEEALAAAFTRFGWTGALIPAEEEDDHDALPELPWNDTADLLQPGDDGEQSGWTMYFDDPAPSERYPDHRPGPDSGLTLFCAGFWPPNGADDTGDAGRAAGSARDRAELLGTADEWAACTAEPQARRADFVAEFDRVHALVRKVFGEPSRTVRGDRGAVRVTWERGASALTLLMEPCAMNYDADDWIALRVSPPANGRETLGRP